MCFEESNKQSYITGLSMEVITAFRRGKMQSKVLFLICAVIGGRIHNTLCPSKLIHGSSKLECMSLPSLSSQVYRNIQAFWAHSQVIKKMKCGKYIPRLLWHEQ